MNDLHDYRVTVHWTVGREGWVESPSLPPVEVATPPQFGGPEGFWSPEHLFVGAVASCFMTTFVAIARNSNLEFLALDVPTSGRLDRGEDRRFRLREIRLRPRLEIANPQDREKALRILDKAHQGCLIANTILSEVKMEPSVECAGVASTA
jgi:organic hydroperoxide reductase OsmC/OhrA